jgi:hypothetical protein
MSPRNTCENRVGRLIEVRIELGYRSIADVAEIYLEVGRLNAARRKSGPPVIALDWRKCSVMAEDAAQHLVAAMRANNARMERSAALLPTHSPVAMLQLLRMLREGKNSSRRGFDEPNEMIAWLSEVLTPNEVARLREFLK